jgi:hypothetical protein
MRDRTLSEEFDESGDPTEFAVPPDDYKNVPGWVSLEFFLRNNLNIQNERSIEAFRKFYNHYLKRFPVHYFTGSSIPGVDFALFFPARVKINGVNNPHYLIAVSQNKKLVLFHKSLWRNITTRANFYHLTKKWVEKGFTDKKVQGYDIQEVLDMCENPETLLSFRRARFSGFFERLQRKLRKMRLEHVFEGKWDEMTAYVDARDRHYIQQIINRIKSQHISFDVARRAAEVSSNNLDVYNWMMRGDNADIVRNRMQLAQYLPWLAKALSMEATAPDYAQLEQAIDKGERLIPILQEFLSDDPFHPISQSIVRKTLHLTISDKYLNLPLLRKSLRVVDDYIPSILLKEGTLEKIDQAQSEASRTFEYLNTTFGEIMGHTPGAIRDEILDDPKFSARIKEFADMRDYMQQVYARLVLAYFANRAHQAGLEGLSDVAQNYLRGELWQTSFLDERDEDEGHPPSFVTSNLRQEQHPPYLRPFGNMAFHNIVKLSVAWHASLKDYNNRMRGVDIDRSVEWPAIYEDMMAPNGVVIRELTSKRQLHKEHEEMGHCVNDYAPNCLGLIADKNSGQRYYSHIFTLATRDGKSRATLELLEPFHGGEKRQLTIGQIDQRRKIKEVMNPPDEKSPLRVAANWMLDMINSGKWHIDWQRVDRQRTQAQIGRPLSNLAIQVGFDPTDAEKCEEAYYLMQPYLPERFRHYSYGEWVKKMGFDREADRMFNASAPTLSLRDFVDMAYAPPQP